VFLSGILFFKNIGRAQQSIVKKEWSLKLFQQSKDIYSVHLFDTISPAKLTVSLNQKIKV